MTNGVSAIPKMVLEIFVLVLAVCSPLLFGSVHAWSSLSLCGFAFLALACYPRAILNIKVLPLAATVGFVAVFIFIGVQLFVSSLSPFDTKIELLKWGGTGAAFLAVMSLSQEGVKRFFTLILWLGLILAVYGLFQVYSGEEMVLWRKKVDHLGFVTGTFFNRNHFAGFLELCIGIQLGFMLKGMQEEKTLKSLGWGILLLVMLFAFSKTGSRMGFLSLAVAVLFSSLLMQKMHWGIRLLFVFLLIALGALFFLGFKEIILQRLAEVDAELKTNDGGRLLAWQNIMAMVKDYPWWGIGLGAFFWRFPYYQSAELHLTWDHAHNDYLELVSVLGIPCATVLFLTCFILIIYAFLRLRHLSESSYPLAWGGFVGITSLTLHGAADFNFAIFGNNLLYFMILAGIYGLIKRERNLR